MYGEGAVTYVSKWFVKFRAGDFLLDDAPWTGRAVEVDSDQIKTLIENNQHYTMQETADILKISKSIKLLVKMKNVFYFLEKLNILFGQTNTTTNCEEGRAEIFSNSALLISLRILFIIVCFVQLMPDRTLPKLLDLKCKYGQYRPSKESQDFFYVTSH